MNKDNTKSYSKIPNFNMFLNSIVDNNAEFYQNEYMFFWKEDGVVCGCWKDGIIISPAVAFEMNDFRKKVLPGRHLALAIIHNHVATITPKAKEILASKQATEDVIKGAGLVNTTINYLLAKSYHHFFKIPFPSKVFRSKRSAKEWLLN